jgi:hypothetical protein
MDYLDYDLTIRGDLTTIASSYGNTAMEKLQLNEDERKEIEYAVDILKDESIDIKRGLVEEVGTRLANILFTPEIKNHFYNSKGLATSSNKGLRIRLMIESPEVVEYPWEAIREDGRYMAAAVGASLTRFVINGKSIKKEFHKPLKILLIGSSPADVGLTAVHVEKEIKVIEDALNEDINNGSIKLDKLTGELSRIINYLNKEQYNVIHFIGHGVFKDNKEYVALEDENGGLDLVDHRRIAMILQNQSDSLGLIVLAVCQGTYLSSSRAFTGLGPELINIGVPAVVAMRYSITNQTAHLFSKEFYSNLLRMPIDENMQRVRSRILIDSYRNPRDFASLVLFMSVSDGIVFTPGDAEAETLAQSPAWNIQIEKIKRAYEDYQSKALNAKDFWLLILDFYKKYKSNLSSRTLKKIESLSSQIPILIKQSDEASLRGLRESELTAEMLLRMNFLDLMGILAEEQR